MKNFNGAHVCAYVSLAVSVILMALWICNVGGFTVVSLDSFVGVIVALLAIIVAFAVAWNIYNGIDLKNDVKEAKDEFNKKVEEVEKVEKELQKEIAALKKANGHSSHLIYLQFGENESNSGNYVSAIFYYLLSLNTAMQCNSTNNVEIVLDRLAYLIDVYAEISRNESMYENNGYIYKLNNEYINSFNDSNSKIRSSQGFSLIRGRYENIWNSIQGIINSYSL